MFSRVLSAAITGIEVHPVWVETDVSDGLPSFVMVGYLSSQVREAQDRVRTALRNTGAAMPPKRITVNLSPADIRKDGAGFDLPIAAAILCASGKIKPEQLEQVFVAGELGLNGEVHSVSGILPMMMKARECGCRMAVVPKQNLAEAKVVDGITAAGVENLKELMEVLSTGVIPKMEEGMAEAVVPDYKEDFADIRGQESLKRAALIAVSGFHNMLMLGPPGSGKSMLAKRITTILPELTKEESLEISNIYSVAGLLSASQPLMRMRPFRSPHHTASPQALAGGGVIPKPGEITLAHRGVLFLDELPEFSRRSLEILRQPLEERKIYISRSSGTYCFPADFLLLAAMNPCPCGYYPDMNRCSCTSADVNRYQNKISFPLLDRIDVCVETTEVSYDQLHGGEKGSLSSEQMRNQVRRAREIQQARYRDTELIFNADIQPGQIAGFCPMTEKAESILKRTYQKMHLSARAYHRIIRVARTIADLAGEEIIDSIHVSEAIQYRCIDRKYWRN